MTRLTAIAIAAMAIGCLVRLLVQWVGGAPRRVVFLPLSISPSEVFARGHGSSNAGARSREGRERVCNQGC